VASGAPASQRAATLRRALELWRGPALADFVYEPFAQREITALEELRVVAIEDRVEADLDLGRHREVIPELEGLIAEHPFRERLRAQLMLAASARIGPCRARIRTQSSLTSREARDCTPSRSWPR
jgi:DNA-binding SARP family transcriptional activator